MSDAQSSKELWPSLPLDEWQDTYATLHMWTQIVGKIRLVQTPLTNHWWNVPLYLTARGLTTSVMPYEQRSFEIDFDFIDHQLIIRTSDGETRLLPLAPRSVADFYREVMNALRSLGINISIYTMPVEVPDPVRFTEDYQHASYDREYVEHFWRILRQTDKVLKDFRARFIGKSSPVHFFWGSFDLAITRFSGRRAPERAGADAITREAYSHEVISGGFWPGGTAHKAPAFYAYAAPQPEGFEKAQVRPAGAYYNTDLSEYLLPYDEMRTSSAPDKALLDFLQSTYEAGANLGGWNRSELEQK